MFETPEGGAGRDIQTVPAAGDAAGLSAEVEKVQAALDDAGGLPLGEKLRLSRELATIRAELAKNPGTLAKLKLSRRLAEVRTMLGFGAKKPEPEKAPQPAPETIAETLDADPDFGLRQSGIKTRERLNAQSREIIERVRAQGLTLADLSQEDVAVLKQYSGRGGLTDNSQTEYFTPTPVAAGTWDLLAANGFANGNVLEPSAGAGAFLATKPAGVVVSGAELDETAAAVAQLLHPEDRVENTSFERHAAAVEDDTYDAVIGNVPFGVRGKTLKHDKAMQGERRLERYFVRRVVDKTRPGGLITLVVPVAVIGAKDKSWQRWRAELSLHAEFLGGHKLPSKTFGKQGTDVVTDIIVLRKHPTGSREKIDRLGADALRAANVLWAEFIEGRYWQGEGRAFIHGQFVPRDPTAARSEDRVIAPPDLTDEAMRRRLAVRFDSRIDWAALDVAPPDNRVYVDGDRKTINGQTMEMRGGAWQPFVPSDDDDARLDLALYGVASLGELEAALASPEGMLSLTADQAFRCWKRYPHLFSGAQQQAVLFAAGQPAEKFREVAYRGSLIGSAVSRYAMAADTTDRERVVTMLQAEVAKYGHPSTLRGMVLDGAQAQAFGVYLGSVDASGNVSANVRGEVERAAGYRSDNILSIVTHLGRQSAEPIDVPAIAALYSGARALKALGDVADVDGVAITPNGEVTTTAAYCCGDVYEKVQALQNAMLGEADDRLKAHWSRIVDLLLSKVKHTDVSAIGFGLRDNWIPARYKLEFLRVNGWESIRAIEPGGKAPAGEDEDGGDNEAAAPGLPQWRYFGKQDFGKQLAHYLNGRSIGHGLQDRKGDDKQEQKARHQEQVNQLEERFRFFMQSHPDAVELAATFDMTFNRHVTPDYDTAPLGLTAVAKAVKLHPYQNAGVRRLSDEGSGILGFDVGLGKSFTSLAYSVYDRQMGRSKKHCFVVPKSVLANWYNESKKFLGGHDNVLFVGFEPKRDRAGAIVTEAVTDETGKPKVNEHTGEVERQDVLVEDSAADVFEKMHRIPAMTTGMVVMTAERFKEIPLRPETVEAYADAWVQRAMTSEANARRLAGKDAKEGSYAEKKRIAQLEGDAVSAGGAKKEQLPFFEDMGFDRVIVDEAHAYKASFQIKEGLDKLAYLPNPAESQRAQDMALKLSHVRENNGNKGAILLTATPVANSPIEIYNMLAHCVPLAEFERLGIYTPADFVRFFGVIDSVQKLTVSGTVEPRDGLKGFKNLNILRGLFNRYANMLSARDVDPEGSILKLPDAVEVKAQAEMTTEQQDLYGVLRAEAKQAGNPAAVREGKVRPMFAVLRDMDRVTTDVDLYRRTMTFVFKAAEEEKLKALIDALPETVMREVIDEDTGEKVKEPVKKETAYRIQGDAIVYVAPEDFEGAISGRLKKFGIGYVSHPLTPKYAELVKNVKAEMAAGGKQLIFTEEKTQHAKLERLLVENLPEDEAKIGIINADTAGGEKLQEIVDAYTRGDFTIVICNKKAEVGVNLQRGTTAVHHMTLPWTPASIQQRNGRAVRQGNKVSAVRIYYYQAKGSFDEYRLDLLGKKAGWINALLAKDNDEDEHDNENAAGDIEAAALLADNREEFLSKVAAQQAKKDAEARERRDTAAKLALGQLTAARNYLRTFDERKAAAIREAEADLARARQILAKYEAEPVDPTKDPAERERGLDRRRADVLRLQRKVETVGADLDAKRADAEARSRQITGTLRAQAARGQLPFAEKLIDAPEDAIVTPERVVVYPGGVYETPVAGGGEDVFLVTAVNRRDNRATVEYLRTAKAYGPWRNAEYAISVLIRNGSREVTMSPDEQATARLLREPIPYREVANRVPKATFEANLGKLVIAGDYFYRNAEGALGMTSDQSRTLFPLYPDRDDRALVREVAAFYGRSLSSGASNWRIESLMPVFFGSNWRDAVGEFLAMASPEQIREKAQEAIRAVVPPVLSSIEELRAAHDALGRETVRYGNTGARPVTDAVTAWAEAAGFVNLQQIRSGLYDAITSERARIEGEIKLLEREAAQAAEEARLRAMRADPRFRELSAGHAERFSRISITARYNNGDLIPGWGQYAALTMKDSRAFNGVLYRLKDAMKSRFGARFVGTKSVGYGSPYADTWAVPVSTDVESLLRFLES